MPTIPDIVTGALRSDSVASQKIPIAMDDYIMFEDESSYRFESLLRRLNGGTESVPNTKVEWMEMGLFPNIMIAQGATAAGETTIPVDHPEYAHLDQVIFNPRTGEQYLLQETTGGGTAAGKLTVVNSAAGTGGITTAIADGDVLIVGPEAHAEGEAVPTGWSAKPRFLYVYTQQSDLAIPKYTDIMADQKEYGEAQLLINRKQRWIEWKRAQNFAYYASKQVRDITSASGPRRHTMRGINESITSNRVDFSGVVGGLTMAAVAELLRKVSLLGASSGTKVGLAGQNAWLSVSTFPTTAIRATQGEKSFGWVINQLVTPFGNLALEYDPTLSAANGLADIMAVLDMATIKPIHYGTLRPRMYLDIQEKRDIHNMEDAISGTFGLKHKMQELSAWGYGIN